MRNKWLHLIAIFVLGAMVITAQTDDDITLEPFVSTQYGITSLAPEGWMQVVEGTLARSSGMADVVILAQQSAPVDANALLNALLPQLLLDEVPESVGEYDAGALTWTLYEIDVAVPMMTIAVHLAIVEQDGTTYLVLLQSGEEEREALYEAVFLPVLDAFTIGADAETTTEAVELPYYAEEVFFGHGDITLAGTLTVPEADGKFPALILITGSGAQDRDESLAPLADIKPFYLIADYLTQAGYAVLRYDDRGFAQSTGDFASASSEDFADDVESAIDYLLTRPEIDGERIGLLGHSEGGLVGAIVATRRDDVAFVISMAGTSVSGREVMIVQNERVQASIGTDEAVITRQIELLNAFFDTLLGDDEASQAQALYDLALYQLQNLPEEQLGGMTDLEAYAELLVEQQLEMYRGAWWQFFMNHNPSDNWSQITIPVLVLLGELDVQVDAEQQRVGFDEAFAQAGNDDYTLVIFPTANHLFQDAITGGVEEYGTLEQDFLPDFLPTIEAWLNERFGG